jgi:hypothetical protein
MFKDYQRDCKDGRVKPGMMHIWKSLGGDWIINFPTKRDWREPSRYEKDPLIYRFGSADFGARVV